MGLILLLEKNKYVLFFCSLYKESANYYSLQAWSGPPPTYVVHELRIDF